MKRNRNAQANDRQWHGLRWVAVAGAALIALGLGGCYEHVVDAKGLSTDGMTVHERQMSDTWIDRALFGDSTSKTNSKVTRQD